MRLDLRTSLLTHDHPLHRESFPKEHAVDLKDLILDITGASILAGRSNVTLRKLFVSVRPLPSRRTGITKSLNDILVSSVLLQ